MGRCAKAPGVEKLANASTKPTGIARLGSPNVAHLMVDPNGNVHLFHDFHLDENDGINGWTNELWALQGRASTSHAVAICPDQLFIRQMGYPLAWSTMQTWNSTDDILDEISRRVSSNKPESKQVGWRPKVGRTEALAETTTAKHKPAASKGRRR